jgi:hypothetical protein
MSYAAFAPARYAMGDTLHFAERINLIEMQPREDLSSTGYALVNPGQEYLVLQPGAEDPFTVVLEPATYSAEWFSVRRRETFPAEARTIKTSTAARFSPPAQAPGPTVLYLRRTATPVHRGNGHSPRWSGPAAGLSCIKEWTIP